jgi:hypothetical protein
MTQIELLAHVSVKIQCEDNEDAELGTGTLISDGTNYYVMTAGHCVMKKSNHQPFAAEDIVLTLYAENKPVCVEVIEICRRSDYSEEKDFAVILVEKPNIDFDYVNVVKRCSTRLAEEQFFFYGYSELNEMGRLFQIKQVGMNQWHLADESISNQTVNAKKLMGGNSGSGVFFEKAGILYHVGYIKRMLDENGSFSDVIVYPTEYFDGILDERTKETNLFQLVEKWTTYKKKEIDEDLKAEYLKNNVEYIDNLERKLSLLYPDGDEASGKRDEYLDDYLKGLYLKIELNKTPLVSKQIMAEESELFEDFLKDRSMYVQGKDARDDMAKIKDEIQDAAQRIIALKDQRNTVSDGYARHSIAEKLLDCSLDYKKK